MTHDRLLNRGRHVFSGGVNYHQGRWTGAFWGNYYINYLDGIDAIVVNPRLSIPKKKNIQTWNIMVTRQLNDNASMYVGVENIFGENKTYEIFMAPLIAWALTCVCNSEILINVCMKC